MRDDALVEALARREPPGEADEVTALLAAWCASVDSAPEPGAPPVTPTAAPGVTAARPARRRRDARRGEMRRAAVAAVTLLGISVAGLVGAEQARPGSPLWPLARLVDHDRARSLVAFDRADQWLNHAVEALDDGHLDAAREEAVRARQALAEVRPRDGRDLLAARLDRLQQRIAQAEAADPGTTHGLDSATQGDDDNHGQRHGRDDDSGDAAQVPAPTPTGEGSDGGDQGEREGQDDDQSAPDSQAGRNSKGSSGSRVTTPSTGSSAPTPAPTSDESSPAAAPSPDAPADAPLSAGSKHSAAGGQGATAGGQAVAVGGNGATDTCGPAGARTQPRQEPGGNGQDRRTA